MSESTQEHRDSVFVIGLLTGAFVGAGLALWLAPRSAAEIRQRVTDRARDLSQRASGAYQQAGAGVGEAVDELTRRGRGVRDGVAGAVARGAHEVERYATTVTTDRGTGAG